MTQFTVYCNANSGTKKNFPYLVDIQSDLLEQIATTIVVPLTPKPLAKNKIITKLCPIVEINNQKYVALTQQLAGIDRKLLGPKVVCISNYRSEFVDAIDFIISGI